jgi:hypothetical protein
MAVREGEEDDVMAGQRVGVGGLQGALGDRQQVWVVFADRAAGVTGRGQRTQGQPAVGISGVPEQQPQNLTAGVSAGTGDSYRSHRSIVHDYAWCCKFIL